LFSVEQTSVFQCWLAGLRDQQAYTRVRMQLLRFGQGNFGDVKPVGDGVSETRLHFGPGYRLYFCRRGDDVILLLAGGDKSSQAADIRQAITLKREIEGR
jgi:putative addiction module killer protein